MGVRVIEPGDLEGLRRFVVLEDELLGSLPLFVPTPRRELLVRLSGRSALHRDVQQALFVASRRGRDIARCAAFVNSRYQRFHREDAGFVGYYASDHGARDEVLEMLAAAESWLRERSVTRVIAPYNANPLAGIVLRTDEFDESPVFPLTWNPSWMPAYLDTAGYRRTYPWWSYRVDLTSPAYRAASAGLRACAVRRLDKRRWGAELALFLRLYNEGFAGEWQFHPHTIEEFDETFTAVRPLLDPAQLLFAEVDGEPVGLCMGVPDWNPLVRRLGTSPGLLAKLRLAVGTRRPRHAGLLMVAVLPQFRGRGVGRTLACALYRRYEEMGLTGAEYHLVNDANAASRALAESLGGKGRVLHHSFDKRLA